MPIEIRRYVKADGWATRYWAVYVGEDLLAVVLYKKGALAVAEALRGRTLQSAREACGCGGKPPESQKGKAVRG